MKRYPLAADRRHWTEAAVAYWDERAGIIQADERCTREEAERRADALARAWWLSGQS